MINILFNKKYNFIHFLLVGSLGVFYYCYGIPFKNLPSNFNYYLIIFIYIFFFLIVLRIKKIFEIIIVLHGDKYLYFKYLFLVLWLLNTVLIFFLPEYLNIILFFNIIFHFLFFLNSSIFTIEDAYFSFSSTIVFFIAASDGSLINSEYQIKFLNLFIIGISVMLFSGGYEKVNSELWQKNRGVQAYIFLPYISRQFSFKFMKKLPSNLFKFFNQTIVLGQLLIFFSLPFPILRELFFFEEIIFSLGLWVITELSFIGQIFTILFTFFLTISVLVFQENNSDILNLVLSPSTFNVYDFIIISIFLFCLIRIFFDTENKILFTINKLFFNFLRFGVFTERHIFSSIYFYRGNRFINKEMNIFDEKFCYTKYNIFSPRYLQSFQYKVTDLLNKKNKKRYTDSKIIIRNYAKFIFNNSPGKAKKFDIYLASYFDIEQWKKNKKLIRSKIRPIKICECTKNKNNFIKIKVISNNKLINYYR